MTAGSGLQGHSVRLWAHVTGRRTCHDGCRAGIETFARELEAKGWASATVTGRLRAIAGFCKYAVEEEFLGHSPAAHVRRPRLDYESHATALDRIELGAFWPPPSSGPDVRLSGYCRASLSTAPGPLRAG